METWRGYFFADKKERSLKGTKTLKGGGCKIDPEVCSSYLDVQPTS